MAIKRLSFENELVKYIEGEYFNGNRNRFAEHTKLPKQQIGAWVDGNRKPQRSTMRYLLSSVLAPEFKIVCEFVPVHFAAENAIRSQLTDALAEHGGCSGIYAFYDSLCNLIYLGKTAAESGLLGEMYQQLKKPLGITFPKAINRSPKSRWQATAFVSAYEIPLVEHIDYPRHVESLILRLSKPVGNKVLGGLNTVRPPKGSS